MNDALGGPLAGITVIEETGGIAVSVAGMCLGDFGADVVKLESGRGDENRAHPGWPLWNRNKRSVLVDPRSESDERQLSQLLTTADVLVRSCLPENQGPIHSSSDLLTERYPALVVLDLPPYLDATPWSCDKESSSLLESSMGLSLRQYGTGPGPVDGVSPYVLYEQGLWGAVCATACLIERCSTGYGQSVVVGGVHAALLAGIATYVLDEATAREARRIVGPGGPHPLYSRYRCRDDQWIFLGAVLPKFSLRALDALGLSPILTDRRIEGDLDRLALPTNTPWVRQMIASRFQERSRPEWLGTLSAADCPAGPVLDRSQWLDHAQVDAIAMSITVADTKRGTVTMPGIPLSLSRSPGALRRSAPDLGNLPLRSLRWTTRRTTPRRMTPSTLGPLAGLRILDLGTVLAGPLAGSLLAELGATVVKVEPTQGDSFRTTGFIYNRGMRSLAINLKSPAGRDALYELVRNSDVVIDNYRLGVLERLGINHEVLREIKQDIVSVSIYGFGDRGPLAAAPGFDPILQAMSGMMSAQGGSDEPVFLTLAVNDVSAGVLAAFGTTLAVLHRLRTGEGQRVSTSLAHAATFMQGDALVRFRDRPPAVVGGRDFRGPTAFDRYYQASDRWLRIHASAGDVGRIVPVLGAPGLEDGSDGEQVAILTATFRQLTAAEAVARLTAAGVPSCVARWPTDLIADEALHTAGVLQRHSWRRGGEYYTPGRLARFSRTRNNEVLVAPGLGEHSRAILLDWGIAATVVERLICDGTVVQGGPLEMGGHVAYR